MNGLVCDEEDFKIYSEMCARQYRTCVISRPAHSQHPSTRKVFEVIEESI